jgi:hypothetical protein
MVVQTPPLLNNNNSREDGVIIGLRHITGSLFTVY